MEETTPVPVSLHTAGGTLRGRYIVTCEDGDTALFDVADGRHHHARWTSTRWKPWSETTFHAQSELGDLALHYLSPVHDPRELEAPR